MKYVSILAISASILFFSCENAASKIKSEDERKADAESLTKGAAAFTFNEEFFDFGDIQEGDQAVHVFEFKNTGDVPLVITSARGSCGCTVPDYPRTPINPGEKGNIKVSFDSNGRPGRNDKTVTIDANTVPRTTVLKITSNVIGKEQ